jgi:peptide/nickel transport system substrate-binding protein
MIVMALTGCTREPEIKQPNAITVGSLADAKRLLPLLASDSASSAISSLVFNGLVKYDENIRFVGDLAESWDMKEDCREVTFHLRKGVKWHDGEELTADDALFTYHKVTDPNVPTPYGAIYGPVESVEAWARDPMSSRNG